jgi:hypothetical protein
VSFGGSELRDGQVRRERLQGPGDDVRLLARHVTGGLRGRDGR